VAVDEERGRVQVQNIDALDGTPVIDLKPYFRFGPGKDARLPGGWRVA
jgi:tRNA (Thr-GGU) A37 N-methylase